MSDMKKVDYEEVMKTTYLDLCNPVKNKEALVLETLSEVFNHVDDVVVYCIRLLVACHRDRLIRRNDWEVVTLRKHSYFMPHIIPEQYHGDTYHYARHNSIWIPTDYHGQTVLMSAKFCHEIVLEKRRRKSENQESSFQRFMQSVGSLFFCIVSITPFILLFFSLFTLLYRYML